MNKKLESPELKNLLKERSRLKNLSNRLKSQKEKLISEGISEEKYNEMYNQAIEKLKTIEDLISTFEEKPIKKRPSSIKHYVLIIVPIIIMITAIIARTYWIEEETPSSTKSVSIIEELDREIELIVFSAEWCKASSKAINIVKEIAESSEFIEYRVIKYEGEPEEFESFGIDLNGLPITVVIIDGEITDVLDGAFKLDSRILETIEKYTGEEESSTTPLSSSTEAPTIVAPAQIEVTDLRITPKNPKVGDNVFIEIDVWNNENSLSTVWFYLLIGKKVILQDTLLTGKSLTTMTFSDCVDREKDIEVKVYGEKNMEVIFTRTISVRSTTTISESTKYIDEDAGISFEYPSYLTLDANPEGEANLAILRNEDVTIYIRRHEVFGYTVEEYTVYIINYFSKEYPPSEVMERAIAHLGKEIGERILIQYTQNGVKKISFSLSADHKGYCYEVWFYTTLSNLDKYKEDAEKIMYSFEFLSTAPPSTSPPTTTQPPTTLAPTLIPKKPVDFEISIGKIENCGTTCREVQVTLENTGDYDAHNVKVIVEFFCKGNRVKVNDQEYLEEYVGTIRGGDSRRETIRLDFGYWDGLCILINGAEIKLKIISEEKTKTFEVIYPHSL